MLSSPSRASAGGTGIGQMGHGGRGGACISGAELTPQGAGRGWVGVLPSSDLGEHGYRAGKGVVGKGVQTGKLWTSRDYPEVCGVLCLDSLSVNLF